MSQGGWKKHLLRSGVPLEYEVAQILASKSMSISADFSFMRRDGMSKKESSVDISADWYNDENDPSLQLSLLIECKYRAKNKTILFVPDPNELYSPVTLGGTIHSFDFAVPYKIGLNSFIEIDKSLDYAYKAIEISDDGAFEEQIWHGIQQIRYGIPVAIRNHFEFSLFSHAQESMSLIFANILVTNAPLRILNEGCTISDIEAAETLESISSERECVILFSDYGPDYEDHVRSIFEGVSDVCEDAANARRDLLVSQGKEISYLEDPARIFEQFESAERYSIRRVSTQFFVVTLDGLENLVTRIQEDCAAAFRDREMPKAKSGDSGVPVPG